MDDQTASALARRLAAYSAAAGVALAPHADAQVVYTDLEPDLLIPGTFPLDFDGDGTTDLEFQGRFNYGTDFVLVQFRKPNFGANPSNGPLGPYASFFRDRDTVSYLYRGNAVGPVAPGRNFEDNYWLARKSYGTFYPLYSPFADRDDYAGFRFVAGDGQLHYGWARISVSTDPWRGALYEYAYEATPGATIVAGDRNSDIALSGTVNQTDFPADGGTLRFTATVTNTTAADAPLDLWLEVGRNGNIRSDRLLGSGTVPAGSTVTRVVAVAVSPGVPANTYDVTFKLGDYGERAVLEAETFVVTKAASASAPGVLDPADEALFAVAPVAGDLFAEASTAPAGISAAHALSAASPNPSRGQTAFTLEVAETRAVRVEVLDALGRRVALVHDGVLAAGAAHRLAFDGSSLPVGVYAVRAVGETFSDVRTLTLTR